MATQGSGPETLIEGCTVIDTPGRYVLAGDVRSAGSDPCIRITVSDVTLTGGRNAVGGYTEIVGNQSVSGAGHVGILVGETGPNASVLEDVTVRNVRVAGWTTGVAYTNVQRGVVERTVVTGNDVGVSVFGTASRNNRVTANTLTGNTRGISIEWATDNVVTANHGSNNLVGLYLSHATGNLIRGNEFNANDRFGVSLVRNSTGNTIARNTLELNRLEAIHVDESSGDASQPGGSPTGGQSGSSGSVNGSAAGASDPNPAAAATGDALETGEDSLETSLESSALNVASEPTISFNSTGLSGVDLSYPTSLQFGPDGRLYVSEQYGTIHALTIERQSDGSFLVTDKEVISRIQAIPNHDDDGTLNESVNGRLVTGLLVSGTASNPVVYVTSSDPRIGGGDSGDDTRVDTNSGMITRLTWNGTGWEQVDLVRGLPRSEENHAPNGMALDESNGTLYLAMGGNTNKGAPSNNFAYLPEYAYSAAILSINLTAIGETTYDLPTLNDTADPFGGQEGDNMARIVSDSPVQVYAPGFRNPYDVVLTGDGKLYSIDNGANSGWGGPPVDEGTAGECTNEVNEDDSDTTSDNLHFVSGEGYYAGHPNPTRANPNGSGYPNAVPSGDDRQCDFRQPGTEDGAIALFQSSTNGIDDYTASNFSGAMDGDLLAAGFGGNVWRLVLTSDGTDLDSKSALFSNFGAKPLDVTAQGDAQRFPGTIWAVTYGSADVTVFEPNEDLVCSGADDPSIDEDGDGYSNADELDAGTNPCSEASQPADADGDGLSNVNDFDDDDDAWGDIGDPFAVDGTNGLATTPPVTYDFAPGSEEGTLLDLGFTGVMTNGVDDYRDLYDHDKLTAGGAANVLTIDAIPEGDAYRSPNDQQYAFQFGVHEPEQRFTTITTVESPFPDDNGTTPVDYQSQGFYVGNGDQDNYLKLVASANGGDGGIHFLREVGGTTQSVALVNDSDVTGSGTTIDLFLTVDPKNDTATAAYAINGSANVTVGTTSIPGNWITSTERGAAVGVIGTSRGPGEPFPGTWTRIEVSNGTVLAGNQPPAAAFDYEPASPSVDESITFNGTASTDTDGTIQSYEWDLDDDGSIEATGPEVTHTYSTGGDRTVTLTVTDDDGANDSTARTVSVSDSGSGPIVSENVTSCGVLDNPGTYTVTQDIENSSAKPCLQINASDVTLDGAGHTIDGNASVNGSTHAAVYVGQTGLNPELVTNVTVTNVVATDWSTGITVGKVTNGTVRGNVFRDDVTGIRLFGGDGNLNHTVVGNRVENATTGISLERTSDTRLADNDVSGNRDGILLVDATDNVLENTTANASTRSAVRLVASGPDNLVTDLTLGATTVSFAGRNVSVTDVGTPPADPLGQDNVGRYVGSARTGSNAFLDVSIEYDPSEFVYLEESSLTAWRYNDSWTDVTTSTVDTGSNVVRANVSRFGVIAPLGEEPPVSYRVNAGGPEVTALGDSRNWSVDTASNPSPYTNAQEANSKTHSTPESITLTDSVPDSTPEAVFQTERFDASSGENMQWDFPVDAGGTYEVRLYFAEIYFESQNQREFDVTLEAEGNLVLDDYDVYADVGHDVGVAKAFRITPDSNLDIDFHRVTENPKISGIEIVELTNNTNNDAPTAAYSTSPETLRAGETVTFDASNATDGDGTIATYEWDFDGDGAVDATGQTVSHTYASSGNQTVVLTVTDDDGAADLVSKTHTIYGESENVDPTAEFTYAPTEPTIGETITFDASNSSDSDGTIQSYEWDFDDDGTTDATGVEVTHTYSVTGSQTVTLTVTDNESATNSTSETLSVVGSENATVAYRVNGGGSNLAAPDDGRNWSADTSSDPSPYTNAADANSKTYSSDDDIALSDSVPSTTPAALFQSERYDPAAGEEMQWDFPVDAGATYEVRLYFAEIYFENDNKREFDVTLEAEGTLVLDAYDVHADVGHDVGVMKAFKITPDSNLDIDFHRVTNNPKISGIEIISVTNNTNNDAPTAAFTYSPSTPVAGEEVTFNASNASDTDGTVTGYEWDFDGDGTVDATGEEVTHTYASSGNQTVVLTVTDDDGAANLVSETVTVATNESPNASFTYSPSNPSPGETVTFDASNSSDPDGSIAAYEWDLDGDGSVDATGEVVTYNYSTGGDRTVTLTVTDDESATDTASKTVTVGTAEATVTITEGAGINASSYATGSFTVTNTGQANVTTVRFNLSTATFPDMVFDPNGTAGDTTAKDFTVDSLGGTGLSDHSFQDPHDGNADDGYDVLELTFTDFQPGETLEFSVDVDPTSIKGVSAPGPAESGSVSGLELTRSRVVVAFETGGTEIGTPFSDGSPGGALAVIKNSSATAPSVDVQNVSLEATTLSPNHTAAKVANASQTVVVSGPAGASVRLLRVEGGLFTDGVPDGGYDLEEYEANSAVEVAESNATIGADGTVAIDVTLTNSSTEAGYNYLTAVVEDGSGDTGLVSNVVVLQYDPNATGTNEAPNASFTYAPANPAVGEEITFDASNSTDPDGTISSYEWDLDGDGAVDATGVTVTHNYSTSGDRTVTLTVTDDDGAMDRTNETVTVTSNEEPTAAFSYAPTDPEAGETIEFDASNSTDSDGTIGSYEWDFDDDGTVDATGEFVTHNYSTSGDKTVTLTVTDDDGATNSTSKIVTVVNQPPNASFTYSPTAPKTGEAITFDGSNSSDSDGSITAYEWDFDGDGTVDATGVTVTHNYSTSGDRTVTLTVTDDQDATNSTAKTVSVANRAPNASFTYSPTNPQVEETITFDAADSTDPDGTIQSYEWDVDEDGTVDATGVEVTHNYSTTGDRNVTLTVTDDEGATNTTAETVHVSSDNEAPVASFTYSPTTPVVGETVTFDAANASDPDGSIQSYEWDLDDDGTVDATGETVTHTYATSGEKIAVLTVTDDDGATNSTSESITVLSGGNVTYRVNAGGPTLTALDDSQNWSLDTESNPSPYTNAEAAGSKTYSTSDTITLTDSVPSTTPTALFKTERWDPAAGDEMQWDFPVDAGATYELRLYFAEIYFENDNKREFDVTLEAEGTRILDSYDVHADVGHDVGVTKVFKVTPDSNLDVDFYHVTQNPKISGFEILEVTNNTNNAAPTADFTYSPSSPTVGDTITFNASASTDSDGTVQSYEWDVDGDGTVDATGQEVTHTYATSGNQTVVVTVTDDDGAADLVSRTVEVTD